ncbi:hypothetical protein BHE74_00049120 [Ensete ventricosum]|nr:hypothetical protein BHE74_00049120 [Ensete ventricosum]
MRRPRLQAILLPHEEKDQGDSGPMKIYGDPDIENVPFAESIFRRSAAASRPFLLLDSQSRINGDDKAKPRQTPHGSEDQTNKSATTVDPNPTSSSDGTVPSNFDKHQHKKANSGDGSPKSVKAEPAVAPSSNPSSTVQLENSDAVGSTPKAGSQRPATSEAATEQGDAKNEGERVQTMKPQVARPAFEDNIVLGVALEGSKRTLPIEEGMGPSSTQLEANELAAGRNGNVPSASSKKIKGSDPMVDKRDQDS